MSSYLKIGFDKFCLHRTDNDAKDVKTTSSMQIQVLKILGIVLLFIGVLLMAGGPCITLILSNPLLLLLALAGLILTVLGTIILMKAKGLQERSRLTGAPAHTPSMKSKDEQDWSEIVSDFRIFLREKFPVVIDETLRDENGKIKRKVFADEKGCRLAFVRGSPEKLRYNPFGDQIKTIIICEAYSEMEVFMRRHIDTATLELFNSTPAMPPGEFACLHYGSSSTSDQGISWSFLCRFGGPFLSENAFEADVDPKIIGDVLFYGFKNLFNFCIQRNINVVQIPLFSFAPGMSKIQRDFFEMTIVMVISDALELLNEDREDFGNSEASLCVNIVSLDEPNIYSIIANI
ncbi:MAG: hypothetical protein RSB82_04410 [Victivallaceae bacterium]